MPIRRLVVIFALSSTATFVGLRAEASFGPNSCEEIFSQGQTVRDRLPKAAPFLKDIQAQQPELSVESRSAALQELSKTLPAGRHRVIVNNQEVASLGISYDADFSHVMFQLGNHILVQTKSNPIAVSSLAVTNGSISGVDAAVHLKDGRLVIINSIYNGNDATHGGLTRQDIAVEFKSTQDGWTLLSVQRRVTTVSAFAPSNGSYDAPVSVLFMQR